MLGVIKLLRERVTWGFGLHPLFRVGRVTYSFHQLDELILNNVQSPFRGIERHTRNIKGRVSYRYVGTITVQGTRKRFSDSSITRVLLWLDMHRRLNHAPYRNVNNKKNILGDEKKCRCLYAFPFTWTEFPSEDQREVYELQLDWDQEYPYNPRLLDAILSNQRQPIATQTISDSSETNNSSSNDEMDSQYSELGTPQDSPDVMNSPLI